MLRAAIASVLAVMALFPTCAEAQWLNHPTPGIPRTADGKPDLSAPVPRTADGKPDLSGLADASSHRLNKGKPAPSAHETILACITGLVAVVSRAKPHSHFWCGRTYHHRYYRRSG